MLKEPQSILGIVGPIFGMDIGFRLGMMHGAVFRTRPLSLPELLTLFPLRGVCGDPWLTEWMLSCEERSYTPPN